MCQSGWRQVIFCHLAIWKIFHKVAQQRIFNSSMFVQTNTSFQEIHVWYVLIVSSFSTCKLHKCGKYLGSPPCAHPHQASLAGPAGHHRQKELGDLPKQTVFHIRICCIWTKSFRNSTCSKTWGPCIANVFGLPASEPFSSPDSTVANLYT